MERFNPTFEESDMTDRMRASLQGLALTTGFLVLFGGCETKGPAEKVGEAVDRAADRAAEAVDPSGPAEKAGEAIDRAASRAAEAIDPSGPAEKAGEEIDEAAKKLENP
jgi:hypothetical protein